MNVERTIRAQEKRARPAHTGELVHVFGGRVGKAARVQSYRLSLLHLYPPVAADHHHLLVRGVKVPGRFTAATPLDQKD